MRVCPLRPLFGVFQLYPFSHRSPYGICPNNAGGIPELNEQPVNHILLFTVFNPLYPITVVSAGEVTAVSSLFTAHLCVF